MTRLFVVVAAIALFVTPALAAEKAAKPAAKPAAAAKAVGSCDHSANGACREYSSFAALRTEADEKKVCDLAGGTWKSKEACPTAKLLGSCAQGNEIQKWYDAGGNKGTKPAVVKDACDALGGKFTAP